MKCEEWSGVGVRRQMTVKWRWTLVIHSVQPHPLPSSPFDWHDDEAGGATLERMAGQVGTSDGAVVSQWCVAPLYTLTTTQATFRSRTRAAGQRSTGRITARLTATSH